MTTPQSRIQIVDVPLLAPGVCFICGTAGLDDRTFIDFGRQIDWYGAVYLCSECIKEVAVSIGFIPVAEFDELYTEFRELAAEKDIADAKYKGVVSALDLLFANYGSGAMSALNILGAGVDTTEESSESITIVIESTDGESEASESDNVEGPDDIFDDSDFE